MKTIFIAVLAAFLAGCSTTYNLTGDGAGGIISSHEIPSGIIQSAKRRTNELGLMQVEITLRASSDRQISYRVIWLDSSGFELKNPIDSQYRTLYLNKNRDEVFTKTASDKRASDFKIEIQD